MNSLHAVLLIALHAQSAASLLIQPHLRQHVLASAFSPQCASRLAELKACATEEERSEDEAESSSDEMAMPPPEPVEKVSNAEALKNIFISEGGGPTEFGLQAGLLTAAFVAFLAFTSTLADDDFWGTPF